MELNASKVNASATTTKRALISAFEASEFHKFCETSSIFGSRFSNVVKFQRGRPCQIRTSLKVVNMLLNVVQWLMANDYGAARSMCAPFSEDLEVRASSGPPLDPFGIAFDSRREYLSSACNIVLVFEAALFSVSINSSLGSESKTIPPPM